jgi:hypothetical protein
LAAVAHRHCTSGTTLLAQIVSKRDCPDSKRIAPAGGGAGRGIVWFIRANCQIRERDFESGGRSGPTSRNARPR